MKNEQDEATIYEATMKNDPARTNSWRRYSEQWKRQTKELRSADKVCGAGERGIANKLRGKSHERGERIDGQRENKEKGEWKLVSGKGKGQKEEQSEAVCEAWERDL